MVEVSLLPKLCSTSEGTVVCHVAEVSERAEGKSSSGLVGLKVVSAVVVSPLYSSWIATANA